MTYGNVQVAHKDGEPEPDRSTVRGETKKVLDWREKHRFALCDTLAFGPPMHVGGNAISKRPLESPVWTTLRNADATPMHDAMPAHGRHGEESHLPCFTQTVVEDWRHMSPSMGRHELQMYPFRVDEILKGDTTRRRDRLQDDDASLGAVGYRKKLHIHKLEKGQELFVLSHGNADEYRLHYLRGGQTYKDFEERYSEEKRVNFSRIDSIREQATFLVDAFPLHCQHEKEFLHNAWCDTHHIFSRNALNMPLILIEGYYVRAEAIPTST